MSKGVAGKPSLKSSIRPTPPAGTGLGLAISKQLVELMGGKIGARANSAAAVASGSRYRCRRRPIWQPAGEQCQDAATFQPPRRQPAGRTPTSTPAIRPLRVLVAEDNKIDRQGQFARILLGKAGHSAEVVETGEAAVAAVRASDYDVVLMPVLDGIEATRLIRAMPPPKNAVTIIAVTAHAMPGAREQYLASGMDGYLSKPLDPEALLRALDGMHRPRETRCCGAGRQLQR